MPKQGRSHVRSTRSFALAIAWVLVAGAAQADKPASEQIFFSKSFPGSSPAYFEVEIKADGDAVYRESPGDPEPLGFKLRPEENAEIFELARKLDYFRKPIASDRKVAFTGDKILRFDSSAGDSGESTFSYTEDADAKQLVSWFERIAESERHLMELERTAQFDRLGVNKALLQFQASFDSDRIVAPEQFLPVLKKIAAQKKYVHIARARAASLVERIGGYSQSGLQ